jgi:hypothetical protein
MAIPETILADLARKAADDCGGAVLRTVALLGRNPQDLFYIALSATAAVSGLASGFAQQCAPESTPEEAADALWMVLRPTIIAMGGDDTDFRELLRQAPKARGEKRT